MPRERATPGRGRGHRGLRLLADKGLVDRDVAGLGQSLDMGAEIAADIVAVGGDRRAARVGLGLARRVHRQRATRFPSRANAAPAPIEPRLDPGDLNTRRPARQGATQ